MTCHLPGTAWQKAWTRPWGSVSTSSEDAVAYRARGLVAAAPDDGSSRGKADLAGGGVSEFAGDLGGFEAFGK